MSPDRLPPGSPGKTVLVVEDEESVRSLISDVLRTRGYQVLVASRGTEALAACEERGLQLDLVVTDVILPGMNGTELVRQLRARIPHLKAIYLSGYPDQVIAQLTIPEEAFLHKPFTPAELLEKIEDSLSEEEPTSGG